MVKWVHCYFMRAHAMYKEDLKLPCLPICINFIVNHEIYTSSLLGALCPGLIVMQRASLCGCLFKGAWPQGLSPVLFPAFVSRLRGCLGRSLADGPGWPGSQGSTQGFLSGLHQSNPGRGNEQKRGRESVCVCSRSRGGSIQ